MKKGLLAFFLLQTIIVLHAQQKSFCGTDEMSKELFDLHPHLQQLMRDKRAELKSFTKQYEAGRAGRSNDSLLVVPVVFHVIHTYGNENISNEQLMSGIKVLNWNFKKQNPDTATIAPAFKSIAADCEIEFRLATIDPNGNCTDGINRIASPYSNIGDHVVKNLIQWDPTKYLNIYVVKKATNLAGHCLMPDQAAAKPEWDGIVIGHDYVGDIGTSGKLTSVVMAHEAGHYLNLFHIWGGNNVPDYYYLPVGQASNCSVGDDVQDTPDTQGWSVCNLTASSCGNVVDNVQNAMDYSYCNFMFTQGQKQRMRATLRSSVAGRNNLVTVQNNLATGVNSTSICKVAFDVSQRIACINDSITFTDRTMGNPTAWEWDYADGLTGFTKNSKYAYAYEGDFDVKLKVTKNSTDVLSQPFKIRVLAPASKTNYSDGFEYYSDFSNTDLFQYSLQNKLAFQLNNNIGYRSAKSISLNLSDSTLATSDRVSIVSPLIDLSGSVAPEFSLRYAYHQFKRSDDDALEIFISRDCGKTWQSRKKLTDNTFVTDSAYSSSVSWNPTDTAQWGRTAFVIPQTHLVSNFMFKIEYTNYFGKALYIDNINIDTVDFNGISKHEIENVFILPNPAQNTINITGDFEDMMLTVIDISGRIVLERSSIDSNEQLDISAIQSGMYMVILENEFYFARKRFVKI
jgi:PKD repeat protein